MEMVSRNKVKALNVLQARARDRLGNMNMKHPTSDRVLSIDRRGVDRINSRAAWEWEARKKEKHIFPSFLPKVEVVPANAGVTGTGTEMERRLGSDWPWLATALTCGTWTVRVLGVGTGEMEWWCARPINERLHSSFIHRPTLVELDMWLMEWLFNQVTCLAVVRRGACRWRPEVPRHSLPMRHWKRVLLSQWNLLHELDCVLRHSTGPSCPLNR